MVTLKGKMVEIGNLEDGSGRGCKLESDGENISLTGMTEDECRQAAEWFGADVEITIDQPDRRIAQSQGTHPAPCARHCEGAAYEIEIRGLRKRVQTLTAKRAGLRIANDRMHRIATIAAEELIRSEGTTPNHPDEVPIPQCQADDHMLDCIAHLVQAGEAIAHKTEDGYIAVLFQDLTLSSLSADDKGGV